MEIFRALAKRLGFSDECFEDSEDNMIRALLQSDSPYLKGITLDRLNAENSVRLNVSSPGEPFLPFADGGFRTSSGNFEFGAEQLAYTPPKESRFGDQNLAARYPLECVSAKNDDSMNSTFGHRDEVDAQTSVLIMHPNDSAHRSITSGDLVQAFNDHGACFFRVRVCTDVPPGVVRAHSTRWNKRSMFGLGINQLTSEQLTDVGGGPTFYSCLVEVLRVTEPNAANGTNPSLIS